MSTDCCGRVSVFCGPVLNAALLLPKLVYRPLTVDGTMIAA
jgi:hypothetical protein